MQDMQLKPNFSLLDFLSHQNGFTTNFDMTAAELLYNAGTGVLRYADDPVIYGPYRNSVQTHNNQVGLDFYKLYNIAHKREYSSVDYKLPALSPMYLNVPIGVFFHDEGEKLGEFQTAYGEMNPDIKAALAKFDTAGMERKVGLTSIRLALLAAHENNPRIFTDFIEEGRQTLDVKANYANGSPTAEQILSFQQRAVDFIDAKAVEFQKFPKWNDAKLLTQFSFGEQHYLDIEQTRTTDGYIGKALEKVEGTTYQNRVNHIKKTGGALPDQGRLIEHLEGFTRLRMKARYEGALLPLWEKGIAEDEKNGTNEYGIITAGIAIISYKSTLDQLRNGKKYITIDDKISAELGEPNPYDGDEKHGQFMEAMQDIAYQQKKGAGKRKVQDRDGIRTLYESAIDSLQAGFITVPEKGKSLLDSKTVTRDGVKGLTPAIADNILRAF